MDIFIDNNWQLALKEPPTNVNNTKGTVKNNVRIEEKIIH